MTTSKDFLLGRLANMSAVVHISHDFMTFHDWLKWFVAFLTKTRGGLSCVFFPPGCHGARNHGGTTTCGACGACGVRGWRWGARHHQDDCGTPHPLRYWLLGGGGGVYRYIDPHNKWSWWCLFFFLVGWGGTTFFLGGGGDFLLVSGSVIIWGEAEAV